MGVKQVRFPTLHSPPHPFGYADRDEGHASSPPVHRILRRSARRQPRRSSRTWHCATWRYTRRTLSASTGAGMCTNGVTGSLAILRPRELPYRRCGEKCVPFVICTVLLGHLADTFVSRAEYHQGASHGIPCLCTFGLGEGIRDTCAGSQPISDSGCPDAVECAVVGYGLVVGRGGGSAARRDRARPKPRVG